MPLSDSRPLLTSLLVAQLGIAGCLAACSTQLDAVGEEAIEAVPLDTAFDNASAATGVPATLLKAISHTESQWRMVEGDEHDGSEPVFGLMGLRGERLARAAELAGMDVEDAMYDEPSSILAAAHLLSTLADEQGIDRTSLADWATVVGAFSGIEDDNARYAYVVGDVYETINKGAELVEEDGTPIVSLVATDVTPNYPEVIGALQAGTSDYPAAIWRPSPNNSARPSGATGKVQMVIIHSCEGNYAGCWGWLKNPKAQASAHYVVNTTGSEITQLVRESRKAWHIAANYRKNLNGGKLPGLNGVSSNSFTVGIEHAGFASQKSWPAGQINASAKLTCNITKDHSITRDKYHIVSHGQLQPETRTDPGKNWPWTHYINKVKTECGATGGGGGGGTPPPPTSTGFVVDSNNSRNDSSKAKIEVSSNWTASNSTAGYHGTGYYFAETEPVSDGASFWFYMPAAGKKTIDAWWTAGTNRSASASFVMFNAAGSKLGTSVKNQQTQGKQWVSLGSYDFTKGWNRVVLSRWSSDDKVVIADAIRVR